MGYLHFRRSEKDLDQLFFSQLGPSEAPSLAVNMRSMVRVLYTETFKSRQEPPPSPFLPHFCLPLPPRPPPSLRINKSPPRFGKTVVWKTDAAAQAPLMDDALSRKEKTTTILP